MHLWFSVKCKDSINVVSSWFVFCRPFAIISSLYSHIEIPLTGDRVDTHRSFVDE